MSRLPSICRQKLPGGSRLRNVRLRLKSAGHRMPQGGRQGLVKRNSAKPPGKKRGTQKKRSEKLLKMSR